MASKFCGIVEEVSNYYQKDFTRTAIEEYTLESLIPYESLKGKTVLDLACQIGLTSRLAVKLGAESVIGVDISPKMVDIAKKFEEETGGSKIKYIVRDVVDIDKLGEFDVVWAMFLLIHAKDIGNLKKMIQVAYNNLKPGSRFIAFVLQPDVGDSWPPDNTQIKKYGREYKLTSNDEPHDGDEIIITLYTNDDDQKFNLNAYWYSHKTLLTVFEETGFVNVKFQKLKVKPEEYAKNGEEYWRYMLEHPCLIPITAEKKLGN
ncbi:S-adenosyl-L-methionine-dependent methyltransferase [Gigaspora rosea]|uniref:S-adenosyl-L-methionine-dependent methyltransferase n=1 Tax=Gigaspora rosea TaxID=44941 RepID=A0A397TUF3_9GLOM|nr:S-adenosyl-L-methionine-dependent methyltransferase [Gigaspora rosea]